MDNVLNVPAALPPEGPVRTIELTIPTPTYTALQRLTGLLLLLRPRQWVKGALVLFGPVVAAPQLAAEHALPLALTLASFLAAASAVYVFNDFNDRDRDRLHPVKRRRPLASGRVGAPLAITALGVLLAGIAALLMLLPPVVGIIVSAYLAMNLWYSLSLKHQPLVDVSIVASGFVLRVLAGTLAVGLAVQPTLLISVYCACLALSLGKRRHELAALSVNGGSAAVHRPSLRAYSVPFLDHVVVVNLVAALGGYVAFIWLQTPPYGPVTAVLTFPFAAFTVHRYLQMVIMDSSGGDPVEDLIHDPALLVNLALWSLTLLMSLVVGLH